MSLEEILNLKMNEKSTSQNLALFADPLQVAATLNSPKKALMCALFSYGNARLIVRFLRSLDFSLLEASEAEIRREVRAQKWLYRFQTNEDVAEIFVIFSRLCEAGLEGLVAEGLQKSGRMVDGVNLLLRELRSCAGVLRGDKMSDGLAFFLGAPFEESPKSPFKRVFMWLRWMVRDAQIDLGLFKNLPKSKLILPLDVHTHRVCLALGLCGRKSYDYKAAELITQNLARFDPLDPVKFDFALYRIGQSGELERTLAMLER